MPSTTRVLAFVTAVFLVGPIAAAAQTITMSAIPQIGAGLQVGSFSVTLSTGQHGGVTVHIATSDQAIARVSNAFATAGTEFFDVFLPNGSTSIQMWVHALEDTTGTATITASAPGFTSANRPAVVVTPACDLTGVLTSIDTLDPNDVFAVRVGLPNAGGTAVGTPQVVRAGGGLVATVTNSDGAIGQLVTTAVTGQSVTVPIAAGNSQSPGSVALGGVAFDGIGVGPTSISGSVPGFTPMTGATQVVNVTQPIVTIPSPIPNVGAGLMTSSSGFLSASEHGGVMVHVESDNPGAILVSPNVATPGASSFDVFLLNGSTNVSFIVHGVEGMVSAAEITVSAPGFTSASRPASVLQPAVDITGLQLSIDTLDPADPFQVRVGLANAGNTAISIPQSVRTGSPGVTATVASLTPSVGTLITNVETDDTVQVTITAGSSASPASVATGGVAFDGISSGTTIVLAQIPGFIVTTGAAQNVTVTQPTMSIPPLSIVCSGLMGSFTSVGLSASQHGGVTVRIESTDSTIALVSPNTNTPGARFFDTFLANGLTAVSFLVHGVEGALGTPNITASAAGFVGATRPVTIVQPAFDIISLATSIDTIDPNDPFHVRVGLGNPGNTAVIAPQPVRAGSPGLDASVVSSSGGIGELVTSSLTGDSVAVHISAGSSFSPNTVALGGVAFHPLSGGIDTVSASIPGLVATTGATVKVTVTQPTILVNVIGDVGSGLQGGGSSATLSATQHGGVTVLVTSQSPSIALVSPNAATPGDTSFTIFVANGSSNVPFVVHGVENTVGNSTIVVSTPAFASGSGVARIQEPGVDMVNLAGSMDIDDPDDPFVVRVGLKSVAGSQVVAPQFVRAGSPGLTATVVSSVPAVGLLVSTALTDDTLLVSIPAGSSGTPGTVAAGGIAFTGIGVGNTLVSARIPGYFPTGNATVSVTITDLSVAMTPIGKVGAGLQSAAISATLGLAQHGGVTVHVASSNPNVALVSSGFATPGSEFIDVFLPNGSTNLSFFVQGVEDTVAATTITASTPGFASAVRNVDVVQPGVQLEQLVDSLHVEDAADPFVIRVGVPKTDLSEIETSQVIRAGGTPMVATVTCSDVAVGVLHTSIESGASVSVTIPVGQSQSGANVASGGVELEPLLVGEVLVSAAITGVGQLQSSASGCVVWGVPDPTPVPTTPLELTLAQNIPNPFNPTTRIAFALPTTARVTVSIFDVHGRLVTTLVDQTMPPGPAEVLWNGRDARGVQASSGVYFYKLTAGPRSLTKKMVMVK